MLAHVASLGEEVDKEDELVCVQESASYFNIPTRRRRHRVTEDKDDSARDSDLEIQEEEEEEGTTYVDKAEDEEITVVATRATQQLQTIDLGSDDELALYH